MAAERKLREKIRQVLRSGRLPDRGPDQIWGGLGSGAVCALCEAPIAPAEIELEIRFRDEAGTISQNLHLRCYSIYEDERQLAPRLRLVDSAVGKEGL